MKNRLLLLPSILALIVPFTLSHAQTAVTGALIGYVSDASAAAVPGATVAATNTSTGVQQQTDTNNDGEYRFSSLIPGNYSLTITKGGFNQFGVQNLTVGAGESVRIDAKLKVGATTTEVQVNGQAPVLQTDSVEVSQTLQAAQIEGLPTFGNNITRLTLLSPGAFMASGQLDLHPENAGEDFDVNINGGQTRNNAHILDGVDNTEVIQGLSMVVTPQDAVQEIKVTTSNYDAQYGNVSGGVNQVTTKSGTNSLHGSAFEYYRTAGFFAADHFSQPNGAPGNVWNQFGGSLGGPIKKDKLFFFGDYQGMRNDFHTSSLYTAPIDAFKSGDFSSIAATNPIYDPATGNPDGTGRTQISCNGVLNVICPARISPAAQKLLALLPEPTYPTLINNNYAISRPATFDQNQFDTRADYFATSKQLIFGKFSYFKATFFTDNVFGPVAGGPPLGGAVNSGNSSTVDKDVMVDYQYTFSPTLLQDFRFAFARLVISEYQLDSTLDTATTVGIPNINLGTVYTTGLPQFNIDGPTSQFSMGNQGLPFFEHEALFQFYDNWTKLVGRNAFTFGGNVNKFFGIRTDVSGRGVFDHSQNLTGDPAVTNSGLGLATFLLGLSDTFSRDITLVQPQEKQWKWNLYGQDNWRVTPKLTLLLGLRWDWASPIFTPKGQSVGNLNLNTGDIWLTGLAGKYAGVVTSKTEFSPRVGLTYRVHANTVVRGGYGRSYFLNPYGAGFGTQGSGWPIKQSQALSPTTPYTPLGFTLDQGPPLPAAIPAFPPNGMIPFPNGYSNYFPGVGKYPHSYQDTWNATVEQIWPWSVVTSIAYVGNIGRQLWDNIDVNAPVPGPGDLNPRRPYFAKYGWTESENQRNDLLPGYPKLTSNYNSLQATIQRRFQNGLFFLSNFTWDKSLDYGEFGPMNIFDFASNYGNSSTTRPWASVTSVDWQLPFGHGKPFGSQLGYLGQMAVGGWRLGGIVNLESGMYFTPTLANNASLNSTIGLRPNRIGSGMEANQNRNLWFNPTDFTVPAPYTYGNSGNDILLGPRFSSTDLSLAKAFAITERTHLDLRWDAFNAFNQVNLGFPNSQVDTSTAGQITSIIDYRRRMQIGAHITF